MTVNNIEVNVTYKSIKNMYLRVVPPNGDVLISAPKRMSKAKIEKFVEAKQNWIKKQRKVIIESSQEAPAKLASGEPLYIWGEKYTIQILEGAAYSIKLTDATAIFSAPPANTYEQHIDYLKKWQRNQVRKAVEDLIPIWEKRTGLYINDYKLQYMKSRWGSCNPQKRRVRFNIHLLNFPPDCLEYVVLHELAHLKIHGHQQDFKALLSKYMPNWQEIRKKLNTLNTLYGHLTIV